MTEHKRNKKRLSFFFVLTFVLAGIMCIAYLIDVVGADGGQSDGEDGGNLLDADLDSIDTISYDCDGKNQTFLKSGGKWIYAGDHDMMLDQSAVGTMIDAVTNLKYERVIADTLVQSAEYGFEQPTQTLTLNFSDGTQKIIYIEMEDEEDHLCYVIVEGDEKIYEADIETDDIFLPVSQLVKNADSSTLENNNLTDSMDPSGSEDSEAIDSSASDAKDSADLENLSNSRTKKEDTGEIGD